MRRHLLVSGTWWKNLGQNVHRVLSFVSVIAVVKAHTIHLQREKEMSLELFVLYYKTR